MGSCGMTTGHCECKDCVNFLHVEETHFLTQTHLNGTCCEFISVASGLSYSGIYRLEKAEDENSHVLYKRYSLGEREKPLEGDFFVIRHGVLQPHGKGWFIEGGPVGPLTWALNSNDRCPPLKGWLHHEPIECIRPFMHSYIAF